MQSFLSMLPGPSCSVGRTQRVLSCGPRPGGPRRYGHDERLRVFQTACSPPPEGETQWTVRTLAAAVGIGKSQTHTILAEADLKPHQVRSWLTSIDPEFETKQAEVCGLYLNPPEGAIVVAIDEKTSVQAKEPIRTEIPPAWFTASKPCSSVRSSPTKIGARPRYGASPKNDRMIRPFPEAAGRISATALPNWRR